MKVRYISFFIIIFVVSVCANTNDDLMDAVNIGDIAKVKKLIRAGANVNYERGSGYFRRSVLIAATQGGHIEIVKFLVAVGAKVNAQNKSGRSALMIACYHRRSKIAKLLLKSKADIHLKDKQKRTILMVAVYRRLAQIVELLLTAGAKVNARDHNGETALAHAVMDKDNLKVIRLLLAAGANVNLQGRSNHLFTAILYKKVTVVKLLVAAGINVNTRGEYGNSPLQNAARDGNKVIVNLLLKAGANIDCGSYTPLMQACHGGYVEIVKLLIAAGANLDKKRYDKMMALDIAKKNKHKKIVELLVNARKDKENFYKTRWRNSQDLIDAARIGNAKQVKILLKKNLNINYKAGLALHSALEKKHLEIVKLLILAKADFAIKDSWNNTVLYNAIAGNHIEIVRLLIASGANIDKVVLVATPLMQACEMGHLELVKLLINAGANVNNSALESALEKNHLKISKLLIKLGANVEKVEGSLANAALAGHIEKVKFLLDMGVDVNQKHRSSTALIYAASKGYINIVKLLVAKGANIATVDRDKNTALSLAKQRQHKEIVKLLQNALAKDPNISLFMAIEKKDNQKAKRLITKANINFQDGDGITFLMKAVIAKNIEIAKEIMHMGTDVNLATKKGATALMLAVKNSNVEIVNLLINKGANVNAKAKSESMLGYSNALIIAAKNSNVKIVKLLIHAKANVNAKLDDTAPLTAAINSKYKNKLKIVKLLITAGADVNMQTRYKDTPLLQAVTIGNIEIVKLLVAAGARAKTDTHRNNPLTIAAAKKNKQMVELLISTKMEVEDEALINAARSSSVEIVRLLVKAGANVNSKERYAGRTPLMYACKRPQGEKIIKVLLAAGADTQIKSLSEETAASLAHKHHAKKTKILLANASLNIAQAAKNEDIQTIIKLIHKKKNVNYKDGYGYAPLHYACKDKGNLKIAKLLIIAKADVNYQDKKGNTSLLLTSNIKIAKLLIAAKADVDLQNQKGYTALIGAIKNKNFAIAKLLMAAKANVNINSEDGTALFFACDLQQINLVEQLLAKGANVHAKNKKGQTAIFYSCMQTDSIMGYSKGKREIVKLLVKKGAKMNVQDKEGATPLLLAMIAENNANVVRFLIKSGANVNAHMKISNPMNPQIKILTPLLLAIVHGDIKLVKILLDMGAKVNSNLIELAFKEGHSKIAQLLKQRHYEK